MLAQHEDALTRRLALARLGGRSRWCSVSLLIESTACGHIMMSEEEQPVMGDWRLILMAPVFIGLAFGRSGDASADVLV
jgi:hypothetical protein